MNSMTCKLCVEMLCDYVSDELAPDQRLLLESHCQCCPPCQIYLRSYQVTIRLTHQLPREAPLPAELECRLLDMLKAAQSAEQAIRSQPPIS